MEPSSRGPAEQPTPPAPSTWSLALVLAGAVLAFLAALVLRPREAGEPTSLDQPAVASRWTPAPQPTGQTVSLSIDFGNGARREFAALPWTEGLTVGALLREAREFQPPIQFTQTGAGPRAFLTSLEGVPNGAAGRSWIFSVNDRPGEASFDVQPLAPGDHVLWRFQTAD